MTVTQDFSQFHSRLKDEPSSLKVASSIYYLQSWKNISIDNIRKVTLFESHSKSLILQLSRIFPLKPLYKKKIRRNAIEV